MDLLTLALFAVVFLFTYSYWKFKDHPHGPYGLPIVGYALFLGKKPYETFKKLTAKYGNIYCLNLGNEPVVVVNDWKNIKEVLITQGNSFSGRPPMFAMEYLYENKDIATIQGPVFKEQKRVSMKILQSVGMGKSSLEGIIMDEVDKMTKQLKLLNGKPVDITSLLFTPVVNVIWGLTAGKNFNPADIDASTFQEAVRDQARELANVGLLNILPALRHIMPGISGFTELKRAKETLLKYLHHEVDEHKQNFDENSVKDFIDSYLAEIKKRERNNNGKDVPPYTKDHLVFTILQLFIGGSDTASNTTSWAILYLCMHPDIQQKVQNELDAVIGEHPYLPLASKDAVPYTEATLLEVQRMASIVPLSVPHCSTKDTVVSGCKIPKGTKVITNLWGMHHDRDYWGDPQNFRPERFLDDKGTIVKHECLLPFSAGPRVCAAESLGKLELHLFFTCLLHRFTFELIPGQEKPSLEPVTGIVIGPKPFSVIVKCR